HCLIACLILGAGIIAAQSFRPSTPNPSPFTEQFQLNVFYIDTAGWYRITPEETALLSYYDLRTSSLSSLPLQIGPWQGKELSSTPEIERWFRHPELVIRRRYTSGKETIWLTIIGSCGAKSFHLFEHTPHSCYPSAGWTTIQDDSLRIPLQKGSLPVRRGIFAREEERFLVYYWYQWDTPSRDPEQGITSWRLATECQNLSSAETRLKSFIQLFYKEAIPWHRF
ncbi:MAG: exosortase-associated EpsI family protein, partial [Anaerolineae bacterium]|nr:exosortase-associated EpsI family protein [Anaerolineae bacterium]